MKIEDFKSKSYQHYMEKDFLNTLFFNKRIPLLVTKITDASKIRQKLLDVYGNVKLTAIHGGAETEIFASELQGEVDEICVDAIPLIEAKRFDFSDFVQIMKRLRADDGCEWDKAQTHDSIRINLIEEAY